MYHVDITEPAEQDIQAAVKYIAEDLKNPIAADRLLNNAVEAILSLEEMPLRYPLVDDEVIAGFGLRFFPVRNYLVFYSVQEKAKTVLIERFIYGKRDWITILQGE